MGLRRTAREKIGVILLEMLHIEDPFQDKMTENPPYVAVDVFFVAGGISSNDSRAPSSSMV